MVPWAQPATSPAGFFDATAAVSAASSFVHFVGNPPQQAFTGERREEERERERKRDVNLVIDLHVPVGFIYVQ